MIELRVGRQTFDFDCGAKALQLVMEYYGVEMREDNLLRELGTDRQNGTARANMAAVARKNGFEVFAAEDVSLDQLHDFIDRGYPVIVNVQAWADKYMTLADWRTTFDYGHYAIVIGYEDHIIIFEDPSSIRRTWMSEKEFLGRWHDLDPSTGKQVRHFAMVLMGRQPVTRIPEHMD